MSNIENSKVIIYFIFDFFYFIFKGCSYQHMSPPPSARTYTDIYGKNLKDSPNINAVKERKFVGILRLKPVDPNALWIQQERDQLLIDLLLK